MNLGSEEPATGGLGRSEGAAWCAGAALRVDGGPEGAAAGGLQLAGSLGLGLEGHGRGVVVAGQRASGLESGELVVVPPPPPP